MGRLLAALATLLILLLGAAFVVPAFVDWNRYRPDIEKAASSVLGRKITFLGDIDIALLPEPHLHAGKFAADNSGGDGLTLTAEAVDVSMALQPLLSGRFEASKLTLVRPELTVDLSKQGDGASAIESSPFAMPATVDTVEIQGGRISVLSNDHGPTEALALTKINGAISAPAGTNTYRFAGKVSKNERLFDLKASAAAAGSKAIKLAANIVDSATKSTIQADGLLRFLDNPVFEGSLSASLPQQSSAFTGIPFEMQLRSAARVDFTGIGLTDAVLTIDSQNRPQTLVGSGDIGFEPQSANFTLQARSLDIDTLLTAGGKPPGEKGDSQRWDSVRNAAENALWFRPDANLHLSLSADQLQLKGELIEGIKLDGVRTGQRWVFDRAAATLPGDTIVKLAGTLARDGDASQLSASAALESKNFSRLNHWLSFAPDAGRGISAQAVSLQGSLVVSSEVTGFEGVTGSIDGTPFTGSLHIANSPSRRLQLALSGENFDLSGIDTGGSSTDALSADGIKSALQARFFQIAPMLGDDGRGFDTADIDVSAGSLKTSFAEAKNLAVHVKFNQDLLTVSKLSAETAEGLTIRGEGVIPLRGSGQGRFDGRLEAKSPQAVLQAAAIAGFDADTVTARRAEDLSPGVLSINYGADTQAGTATAVLGGSLGPARVDGRVQLKGNLSDWKTGLVSAQFGMSAPDGNKLLTQFFPKAAQNPGASLSPGVISLRVNGTSQRLDASGGIKAGSIQVQLDGAAEFKPEWAFTGKISGSSQMPEVFLPSGLLALLGGEPKANLRLDSNLALSSGHLDADKLRAESPRNVVTGHLALDTSGSVTRVDADLKADQASLSQVLSYFIVAPGADQIPITVPASLGAPLSPADIWTDRPFTLSAFQTLSGKVALSAKTVKLSDSLSVSDSQLLAKIDKGRLDIQRFEGKALAGDLSATLNLEAQTNGVGVRTRVSLSNADLSAIPNPGTAPIIAGKVSLSLSAAGQGLSPRGLMAVLQGRGQIAISDGQLSKFSPSAVQKSAEDLLAAAMPLTEDTITKKVLDAAQSGDLKFRRLKIPVAIRDGMLEIRRASFRGRDGTVRMEAYLDLAKMQVDSTWQAGVSSDRRAKWPPVKIQIAGPLRDLGSRPRTLAAEDFVRAILVRKMEGDITRLEGLNKTQTPPPAPLSSWTTTQEPVPKPTRRGKRDTDNADIAPADPASNATVAPRKNPAAIAAPDFETRMRDALQSRGTPAPEAR